MTSPLAGITVVAHAGDSGYSSQGYADDRFSATFEGGGRPSVRVMAMERAAASSSSRSPGAALDTLVPSSTPTLLSAQEAKERLRKIVEGFFFRRLKAEDGKRIGRLLIKSPPGLGKTREAIDWVIC